MTLLFVGIIAFIVGWLIGHAQGYDRGERDRAEYEATLARLGRYTR